MRYRHLLLLLLGFGCWLGHLNRATAQNTAFIDSLTELAKTTTHDSTRVLALLSISAQYAFLDTAKQRSFHRQAHEAAMQTGDAYLLGRVYTSIATREKDLGRSESAKANANKALAYAQKAGGTDYEPVIYLNLGNTHMAQSSYVRGIQYFRQALGASRKNQQPDFERHALASLSICYNALGRPDSAIYYATEVTRLSEAAGHRQHIANSYLLLASTYTDFNREAKARDYTLKSIATLKRLTGQGRSLTMAHTNASRLFQKAGQHRQALAHSDSAIHYSTRIGNNELLAAARALRLVSLNATNQVAAAQAECTALLLQPNTPEYNTAKRTAWIVLGKTALQQGLVDSAETCYQRAMALVPEGSLQQSMPHIYFGLARVQLQRNNADSAEQLLLNYQAYVDSLNNAARTRAVAAMQAAFEEEQSQLEIEQLNEANTLLETIGEQQANMLIGAGVALSLLLFLAAQLWRSNRKRAAANKLLAQQRAQIAQSLEEKEVLLREIHHRVKNNLHVVHSLLVLQASGVEDARTLNILHESQARVLSIALIHQKLYEAESLARIDLQAYLQQLIDELKTVFHGSARPVEIDVSANAVELDVDTAVPVGLIVNELVSNSFKHAANGTEAIRISIAVRNAGAGACKLTVQDNGPGLPANVDWEQSSTLGMRLVRLLAKQINGSLHYTHQAGALFTIHFTQANHT